MKKPCDSSFYFQTFNYLLRVSLGAEDADTIKSFDYSDAKLRTCFDFTAKKV